MTYLIITESQTNMHDITSRRNWTKNGAIWSLIHHKVGDDHDDNGDHDDPEPTMCQINW